MQQILGVVLAVSVVAVRAHAQPADASALAEQLFNQGRDLAKANRWAEACPKFEASLRHDPEPGTRLNLATCYEHIGKLTTAWGLYRESIELANKAGNTKRASYARKQAAMLEPRLPKLAISVPAHVPAGFVVTRDGATIDAGEIGAALYVDPGTYNITASAPGFESFTVSVTLIEGKTETLAIPALAAKPVVGVAAEGRVNEAAPPSPASRTRPYVALGAGVAGVAAVGVGLVFGAKANSTYHDAQSLCGANLVCSPTNYDRARQLTGNAESNATTSTVLVVAGGAAIVTGVVMYLTSPGKRERATARLVPVSHEGGAGLAIAGSF